MQTLLRRTRLIVVTVIALILVAPVFADDIPTAVSKNPEYSTFGQLLQAADLVEAMKQPGPFTVLVPNNEAFAKLTQEQRDTLLKPENKTMLRTILLYHVVPGKMTVAQLTASTVGVTEPTLVEGKLTLTSLEPLTINNARLIKTDIPADNGVIHVIDTLLMPAPKTDATEQPVTAAPVIAAPEPTPTAQQETAPAAPPVSAATQAATNAAIVASQLTPGIVTTPLGTTSITEVTTADPQFSTFNKLIKAAGFDQTLMNRGPMTVFAPTDEAFNKLPKGTVDNLLKPENLAMLQAILEYHFLPGQYTGSDVNLMNGQPIKTTLQGATVNINTTSGVHVNDANVVKTDMGAKNGVVHVLDTVLMPPETMLKKNDAASIASK